MTIGVVCPHCESRFQLSPELVGKSMRCPNSDCREVFVVSREPSEAPTVTVEVPAPANASGKVSDFVQVLDAEPVDAEPIDESPQPKPKSRRRSREPRPVAPLLKAAPILPAAKLPPGTPAPKDGPKEVAWSDQKAPPPPAADKSEPAPQRVKKAAEVDDTPLRSRPQKSQLPKIIFIGLFVTLLSVGLGTLGLFIYHGMNVEEEQMKAADAAYGESRYAEARKQYDDLLAAHPDGANREKYRFFGQLSGVRASISGVTTKDNPAPALDQLRKFIRENADAPMAQPNTGFGADIAIAGNTLCLALNDHAVDRVKAYRANRTKLDELKAADQAIADGKELIPVLEKFRDKTTGPFDAVRIKYEATLAETAKEWKRLDDLKPWRTLADDPNDKLIAEFEKKMREAGLDKDSEVLALVSQAKSALRKLVLFARARQAPELSPSNATTVTALAPRVFGSPNPKSAAEVGGDPDTVFAVARGVLYVLDAHTGNLLWAERVATDSSSADAPLRFISDDGSTDWLIVPSVLDGVAGLTARQTRTGISVWHQPLTAPVLGRPVRIGSRLFVGLKDDDGSLLQVDVFSGQLLSRGELRQPIGGGLATLRGTRSSHGFLVVPADARRVFLFEVGAETDDPRAADQPKVVRVLATDHPKGSLRGEPLLIDPDDPTALRRLVLTQTDLPTTMKIRSFGLPNVKDLSVPQPDGDSPPEQSAEAPINGWAWFPPVSDGERVAVATDSGSFAVFGLNQPGNTDKPLFQIPGTKREGEQPAVSRGLVVSADEDSFWVVSGGKLLRLRAAVDPKGGFRIEPDATPRPVGEPIARGQVRAALNLGFLTVKANDSATSHMLAFDLTTGEVKWRRQLGAALVTRPIVMADGLTVAVDEAAGVYRLTAGTDVELLTVDTLAEPLAQLPSAAVVATPPDRKSLWVLAPQPSHEGQQMLARKFEKGKMTNTFTVTVPSPLAGTPAVSGEHLLLPLANGFVYRIAAGEAQPTQGPVWRGANAKPDSACYLTVTATGEFVVSDGDTRVFRWKWDANGQTEKAGGPWESLGVVSGHPVLLNKGGKDWLVTPDAAGVSAFDPSKPTAEHVRRWKGAAEGVIPPGRATHLTVVGDRLAYCVEGKAVVGIDPLKDQPEWAISELPTPEAGEVLGIVPSNGNALVTYQSGHVREIAMNTGQMAGDAPRAAGSPLASTCAIPGGGANRVILCSTDGVLSISAVVPNAAR